MPTLLKLMPLMTTNATTTTLGQEVVDAVFVGSVEMASPLVDAAFVGMLGVEMTSPLNVPLG